MFILMNRSSVGIDALAIAAPRTFLELTDLAAARGVAPEKYTKGLGAVRMAIADRHEDPVTLAADAALRMFARSGADPARVGFCAVGTETAVDHSKPVASYVHGLLGLPRAARVYDAKHACFGGTAALLAACEWIASGAAKGRTALVVCSDIARYALGSPGEPTQGAGAVAMLVSESPRLLEIEIGNTGSYARDVHDFWRPLNRRDALVDGHFSVSCYLDALAGAYGAFATEDRGAPLARCAYHVPYVKMAMKADRHRAAIEGLSEEEAERRFAREVRPSLAFAAEVGNVYTGSLYMAVASLLSAEADALEGERVGLFSYGSGCVAEFFAARVARGAGALVRALDLGAPLRDRVRLSIEQYEAIRRAESDEVVVGDRDVNLGERAVFLGIDSAERRAYSVNVEGFAPDASSGRFAA
ncbi:MAG: hydroxymethylglutaryl-CoA synthase [Labilithrix sp.]|nr:hydroxymethylglutaryl-CoA synthase [Labilithrix sp.]MCW5809742.1 hydroxymethylglutaryl-CoA synthase [Labilithrix sp.]